MAYEFKLPDLGEGITEGVIVKWLVKEGDDVAEHQPVVEIETDKAIVEVPSPRAGRLAKTARLAGDAVAVGETLFTLDVDGAASAATAATGAPAPAAPIAPAGAEASKGGASVVGSLPVTSEVLATPKVRSLAKRLGVEIGALHGTGPDGSVTEHDVREAASARPSSEADRHGPIERVPISGVRAAIIKKLVASQRMTAFVTAMQECDVTELWALKARESAAAGAPHLTFMPFFMKAVDHALRAYPLMNGTIDEQRGEIVVRRYYHIGVAVDTPDGLMVSVVRDVDKKTIVGLATELAGLSKKARERTIALSELKGSTFTITNFGTFGGHFATPIINHPEVGILGTGRIADRPWVVDGAVAVRKILPLSLTFDHRVLDGSTASAFMNQVASYLEDPARLLIESA